ncbi:MAG: hypothetical protein AAFQ85_13200 [Pseudomonadota bacterium]
MQTANLNDARILIARIGPIRDTEGHILNVYVPLTATLSFENVVFSDDEIRGVQDAAQGFRPEHVALMPDLVAASSALGFPTSEPRFRDNELIAEIALGLRPIEGVPPVSTPRARRHLFYALGALMQSAALNELQSGSVIDAELQGRTDKNTPFHGAATLEYRYTLEPGLTFALQDLEAGPAHVLLVSFRDAPRYAAEALGTAFGLPGVPYFNLPEGVLDETWSEKWLGPLSACLAVAARLSATKPRVSADTELANDGEMKVDARFVQ